MNEWKGDPTDREEGSPPLDAEWLVNQVAHALRNPIFAVTLQAESLALEYDDPAILDILRQLQGLGHIVEDMLLFGRPVSPDPRTFEARRFLESVAAEHRAGNRYGAAEISLQMAEPELAVRWDEALVRTVLDKVLSNAMQHTEAPHRIGIEVTVEGPSVRIVVSDDGDGIDPELMERIFLPFQPQHHGRPGLGLAIARKLCQAMGGSITLSSTPGRGTTVTIVLPREMST